MNDKCFICEKASKTIFCETCKSQYSIMAGLFKNMREFMTKGEQYIADKLEVPPFKVWELRKNLIAEELKELATSFVTRNKVEMADALVDLMYVVVGTCLACGIDQKLFDELWKEVHRSNMTKCIDPVFIDYGDGDKKLTKGKHYDPPRLKEIIERHSK